MKKTKRKTLLALLSLTVSVAWANDPIRVTDQSAEKAVVSERAAGMVEKLRSDVSLSSEQQIQITALAETYFQERQAVLETAGTEKFSEEVMMQLKVIQDRYQMGVDQVLSTDQQKTIATKREERKNVAIEEARTAAREAATGTKQTTINK